MGSEQPGEHVSLSEAEALLEVSRGTLMRMVKNKVLQVAFREGGKRFFRRADVLAAKAETVDPVGTGDATTIALQARTTANSASAAVQHLYEVLGLVRVSLDVTPQGIESLLREVTARGTDKQLCDASWVKHWGKVLMSIDEDFLLLVSRTGVQEAWEPFLSFANDVLSRAPKRMFRYLEELHRAFVLFETARNQLRGVSYFFVRGISGKERAEELFPRKRRSRMDVLEMLLDDRN